MVDDGSTDGSAAIAERVRRARPALPARHASPTAASSKARNTGIDAADGRVPRLRRQRRRAAAERLRAAARRARGDRLGLRHRQRPPLTSAGDRARRRSSRKAFAETRLKTHITQYRAAARRPHGLEQAVAALVLGRARASASPRAGCYEDIPVIAPGALPGRARSTSSPSPVYLLPHPRGRRTCRSPSGAPSRTRCSTASPRSRTSATSSPQHGPRRREALVRRERRRRRPALLPQRPRRRRRRVPRAVPRPRQRVPRPASTRNVVRAAAGDRAAQVAPRAAPADARAARGAALPARGAARHAAGADRAGAGTATTRSAPTARLSDPARRSTGSTRSSRCAAAARRRCAWDGERCGSSGYAFIDGIGAPARGRPARHA